MGRFDDEPARGAQQPAQPQVDPPQARQSVQTVIAVIRSVPHPAGMRPYALRDAVRVRLQAMGWWTRTRYKVASRNQPPRPNPRC